MFKHQLSIALTATALLGFAACEREKVEEDVGVDADIDTAGGAKTGEPVAPRTADDERMSADMQQRLTAAEERYTALERETTEAKKRLETQGGEVRVEFERDVEQALTQAKNKLEMARKATAKNARDAIDELDKAIQELDMKLDKYEQT